MVNNMVVVITGASSGIGQAAALRLANAGAKVVLSARRTERLKETVQQISEAGGAASYFPADVVSMDGAVYSGTKFAVRAITEGLRMELSPTANIRATIISPGMVETELLTTITDEDALSALKSRASAQALQAEDIANAIFYAIDQPEHAAINEILIRPTTQPS